VDNQSILNKHHNRISLYTLTNQTESQNNTIVLPTKRCRLMNLTSVSLFPSQSTPALQTLGPSEHTSWFPSTDYSNIAPSQCRESRCQTPATKCTTESNYTLTQTDKNWRKLIT